MSISSNFKRIKDWIKTAKNSIRGYTTVFMTSSGTPPKARPKIRGTLLTIDILEHLDFSKIILLEFAETGAMGDNGGIVLNYPGKNDKIERYVANYFFDIDVVKVVVQKMREIGISLTDDLMSLFWQDDSNFLYYNGGFGNSVYINDDVVKEIEVDNESRLFIYKFPSGKRDYLYLSVFGVFKNVVRCMFEAGFEEVSSEYAYQRNSELFSSGFYPDGDPNLSKSERNT